MLEGRLENELKIDKTIQNVLKEAPKYVVKWNDYLELSETTAASRLDMIRKVLRFLKSINSSTKTVKVSEITESAVVNYFKTIKTKQGKDGNIVKTSDSYRQSTYSVISVFFDYLESNKLIKKNYLRGVKRPKNNDLVRINANRKLLTGEDFKAILDVVLRNEKPFIKIRDYAIMQIFMNTGIRKTSLCSINISDIDFDKGELIVVDKGDKTFVYALPSAVIEAIEKWLSIRNIYLFREATDALFLSQEGHRISIGAVMKLVKKYTKEALGKELSPHKIRSGYCSILYSINPSVEFVQKAVGHSNIQTTQRYIVTDGKEQKFASELIASVLV